MKLLHFSLLLLLGFIQSSITSAASSDKPEVEFKKLYKRSLNLISIDFCKKIKIINEQILRDKKVQRASTPTMRDFKGNMTLFKESYPLYQNLNMSEDLVLLFSDMVDHYLYEEKSTNKDIQYISQLLDTFHYDTLCDEYEEKLIKFMKNDVLPHFETYRKNKSNPKFSKWMTKLNKCRDYECFYNNITNFFDDYTTLRKSLLDYIEYEILNLQIFYGNFANRTTNAILKDPSLTQLEAKTKQQLTRNLNNFIRKYNSNRKYKGLYDALLDFYNNIITKFYEKPQNISKKDQEVLNKIFEKQNYKQFVLEYRKKFNQFAKVGLYNAFEDFEDSLNPKQLAEEKDLLDWFNNFKRLRTLAAKNAAFDKLFALSESKM